MQRRRDEAGSRDRSHEPLEFYGFDIWRLARNGGEKSTPVNQYDSATQTEGNANDQSARVATEQQNTNSVQQQVQSAQQQSAPDPVVQMRDTQDQQVRKQQSAGMSMSVW